MQTKSSLERVVKRMPFVYKPIVYVVGKIGLVKRKIAYRRHGKEALQLFVKCMDENNFKYTLAFGSILGAIREHGFIKHDLDIDTFVWYEDYSQEMLDKLVSVGFSLYRSIFIDSGNIGREDTLVYKGVSIDIFYLYPAIDIYPYCCDFIPLEGNKRMPRRIEIPLSRKRKIASFEGIPVYIPDNSEEICEFRYGPDYMIPNPKWHWKSSYNAIKEWPEMIDKTTIKLYPIR